MGLSSEELKKCRLEKYREALEFVKSNGFDFKEDSTYQLHWATVSASESGFEISFGVEDNENGHYPLQVFTPTTEKSPSSEPLLIFQCDDPNPIKSDAYLSIINKCLNGQIEMRVKIIEDQVQCVRFFDVVANRQVAADYVQFNLVRWVKGLFNKSSATLNTYKNSLPRSA